MTIGHDAYLRRRRFEPLDGIRCLSVLPVVLFHSAPVLPTGPVGRGPLGVDMFFALSGFLITTLLLRERSATQTIAVGAFWARRARRIFPLYFLVLVLYAAYAAWALPADSPVRAHFFRSLPFYATYTTNLGVDFHVSHPVLFAFSWSLAIEEQFYAVWPLLLGRARWFAAAAAAILGWTPLALGAMAAMVLHDRRGFALLGAILARPLVNAALWAVAVMTFFVDVPLVVAHLSFALLVAAAAVAPDGSPFYAWLNARPVKYVGQISYGVYLLHVSGIALVRRLGAHDLWAVFGCATCVTLALAAASRRWFEARWLR